MAGSLKEMSSRYDPDILAAEVIDIDKQAEIIMEIINRPSSKSKNKGSTQLPPPL